MTADFEDQQAIIAVLHGHCRGLDRNNSALIRDCYWPDATVDYGSFVGAASDFAELIGPALTQSYELTRHCVSNVTIVVDGGLAQCESYVEAAHLLRGAEQEMCFRGRYLDTLEREDRQWRIRHRQVVMDWSVTRDVNDERNDEAFAALAKGRADLDDPSYALFQGDNNHG